MVRVNIWVRKSEAFIYTVSIGLSSEAAALTTASRNSGAVSLSPLVIQTGIRRQDGPGLAGWHAGDVPMCHISLGLA